MKVYRNYYVVYRIYGIGSALTDSPYIEGSTTISANELELTSRLISFLTTYISSNEEYIRIAPSYFKIKSVLLLNIIALETFEK